MIRSARLSIASVFFLASVLVHASEPEKEGRPFDVESQRDGIKIFRVRGKGAAENHLLPPTPKSLSRIMAKGGLADVPEIALDDLLPAKLGKEEVLDEMEFRFAKANFFNLKQTDGYLKALIASRPDLVGLPFRMGTDCHLTEEQASALAKAIGVVRGSGDRMPDVDDTLHESMPAAMMQIGGASTKQAEIASKLSTVPSVEATRALARLAVFSLDDKAREIAAKGLKVRRDQDYTDILLEAFRYPWPPVARKAAEALVRMNRKELLPKLVEMLDATDPRLPASTEGNATVRELVRINHHRNCLLCHAPAHVKSTIELERGGQRDRLEKVADALEKRRDERDFLFAAVPLPNKSFDSDSSSAYRNEGRFEHIMVRVDVTYLRQDFSAKLPVEDSSPWPTYQRFDFLVRTRKIDAKEAESIVKRIQEEPESAPYRRAILFALREMTGKDAVDASEWRRVLKLPTR
jgi:hypothetical protein